MQRSQTPQTQLISETTRRPNQRSVGGRDDVADELVPEHAGELHVAFADLQIGRADAGLANANQRVTVGLGRVETARFEAEGVIENKGAHGRTAAGAHCVVR